jgi:hypothetical protein
MKENDEISINSSVMALDIDSNTKSDSKESGNDSHADSLRNLITSARKTLFNSTPPAENKDTTITSGCLTRWVPIWKTGDKDVTAATGSLRKGATFVADMNFKQQDPPPAKKTPSKGQGGKLNKCMVKAQLKVTQGATNVQQTVLGLMDHCLAVLHKQDKMVCVINGAKTLQAYKATDLPREFTDFHNNWGKWDEPVCSFLNTLLQCKGQLFM